MKNAEIIDCDNVIIAKFQTKKDLLNAWAEILQDATETNFEANPHHHFGFIKTKDKNYIAKVDKLLIEITERSEE